MAVIKSGASTDQLTIDAISKAARVTIYDTAGNTPPAAGIPVSGTITANQGTSPWVMSLASTTITGSVAVTGNFFQATQPISGTITANAGTGTFLVDGSAHTQPVSGNITANIGTTNGLALDSTLTGGTQKTLNYDGTNTIFTNTHPGFVQFGSAQAVTLASTTITGSVAVTGTFFQATQPISGTITANQGTSPWIVSLTSTTITGSVAVTGTFFQATQPVSGTITANQGGSPWSVTFPSAQAVTLASTTITGSVAVTGTFFQATQPVSAVSLPLPTNAAQETGGNLAATASQFPAATAKGTQAATFGNVQSAKDTGRTKVILTLTKATSITAEALVTLTQKKGTAATTTGTSYTVAAGKTLRIQAMLLSATLTVAGLTSVAIRLREGAAGGGAVSAASDIISELEVSAGVTTVTIGQSTQQELVFPDGLELIAGQQIGVSELASTVDAAVTVVIVGYEY
jgi:hypothetical protein